MAIVFVAALGSTSNASSYATASFGPTAGDLLLFMVAVTGATGASPSVTDSLNELSYTMILNVLKNSSADTLYVFVSLNGCITSSVRTLTFHTSGGTTATGAVVSTYRVSGQSRYGLDAIRQVASQANQAASTTPAPVFGKAALTGNPCFSAIANQTSSPTLTVPTSWTGDGNTGYSSPTSGFQNCHITSGFTGTTVTWGSTSATAFGSIAVEIDTSTAPISPQLYIETETENPGFNVTLSQGLGSLAISEADYGDYAEGVLPQANTFLAPLYTDWELGSNMPGFNSTITQGLLSEAELTYGNNPQQFPIVPAKVYAWSTVTDAEQQFDTTWRFSSDDNFDNQVEVLPSLFSWEDIILMGYRGYYVSKALMTLADEGVEKVQPYLAWDTDADQQFNHTFRFSTDDVLDPSVEQIQPYYAWDSDEPNQFDHTWRFSSDDVMDPNIELIPFLFSATDIILMSYRGYYAPKALMTLADEGVEKVQPYLAWDTDADQQFDHTFRFSTDDESDMVELVQPYLAWDTDADQQFDITWRFTSDDVLDSGIEQIQPYYAWDTDADQQFDITWRFSSDDQMDSSVEYITLPYNPWDSDQDSQDHTWAFRSDDNFDNLVEEIPQLYTITSQTLMGYSGYRVPTRILAEQDDCDIEHLPTPPFDPATVPKDDDQAVVMFSWVTDDLMDAGVEQIQPYYAWDNDEENQLLQLLGFGQDTLSDEGVEYIILPPFVDEVDDLVDE